MKKVFVGIEIGGTKLQIALGDREGRIRKTWRSHVDAAKGAEGIKRQIEITLKTLLKTHKPSAVGVGFGGPVDWLTGRICRSHQIEGWSEFDLRGWLESLCGCPVSVDNDANIAALGEAVLGSGMGFNPVFYVTLGSGVGGGLVVDGKIYHGAIPGEAEIGHVRLDRTGTTVESRCSGWAVDARIRELKKTSPASALALLLPEQKGGEARFLSEAVRKRDPAARHILSELADDLAFGLSHVIHLFHPQVIILGGGLSQIGAGLKTAVAEKVPRFVMAAFHPVPRIDLAELGQDVVPVGALVLADAAGL